MAYLGITLPSIVELVHEDVGPLALLLFLGALDLQADVSLDELGDHLAIEVVHMHHAILAGSPRDDGLGDIPHLILGDA
eukprot:scaffold35658_cov163-Isochrysis_galbana.AAC.1